MLNEADTCRIYVEKHLAEAGWVDTHVRGQYFFTDGRVVTAGGAEKRQKRKFADYLLQHSRDLPLAVVEAKAEYKQPGDGLGQAMDYAAILGLPFAYATNGRGIVEFDRATGLTTNLDRFPTRDELWARFRAFHKLDGDGAIKPLLQPDFATPGKTPRYYQRIAINRAVEAIGKGHGRVLLTMATGTGKTTVAFQICWKLTEARWTRDGAHRKPRILFLADRDFLVGDPMTDDFAPFDDGRWRVRAGNLGRGRQMYFSTYQALTGDGSAASAYKRYARDYFDLIVVDECHRGSASEESSWREILEWFAPAAQLGMTATPLRNDNRDTYAYFGGALYTYSLRQGIEDGFLAPYRVHRIVTDTDATGWRPDAGTVDRFNRLIPDEDYQTVDFERRVALKERTKAIAAYVTTFLLQETDPMAKTIVFCVDQEHALEMRDALGNANPGAMRAWPDYAARVTADEGEIGKGHLSNFQDIEKTTPVILTTSQLLTTGVDAPTCKNIVLARMVGSITEFKQILGRGTRLREEYGKLSFNVLDFTGAATRHFADPAFDGDPITESVVVIDAEGQELDVETVIDNEGEDDKDVTKRRKSREGDDRATDYDPDNPRKFYFDGGAVSIAAHTVQELDPDGHVLRTVKFTDYAAEKVRALTATPEALRAAWTNPDERAALLERLAERGLTPEEIAERTGQPGADELDLLCSLAFGTPVLTRRERATRLGKERAEFFERYGPEAREILRELVEKYAEHGIGQLRLPDVLKLPPISDHGNPSEIAARFGGTAGLRAALADLQGMIYYAEEAA